jgi:HSP20 family molecular chaperone IbpA
VDRASVEASFRDGVLSVRLPVKGDRQPGPIQVAIH